jgi:hypothetical protein
VNPVAAAHPVGLLPAGDQPEYLMADMDAVAAREVLARLLRLHRAGRGRPETRPWPSSRFVGSPATSTHTRRASRDDRLFPPE